MLFSTLLSAESNVCNIFFDGTTNDKTQGTNVWNMFNALEGSVTRYTPSRSSDLNKDSVEALYKTGSNSRAVYVPGVGTSTTLGDYEKNLQAYSGKGIERRALVGYAFLTNICEVQFGKTYELKIVGFSRGATTAIMFATYLSLFGISIANTVPIGPFNGLTSFEQTLLTGDQNTKNSRGRIPQITFLGLFDTVASIGFATRLNPGEHLTFWGKIIKNRLGEEYLCKLSIKIPLIVEKLAHAVAINEYREAFHPTLINKDSPKWVEMFFIGSHSDIGGFKNSERQKIALSWMVQQGFQETLKKLFLAPGYILNLRGSPLTNSYDDFTILEGPYTRPVDWKACSVDTLAVAKDGHLSRIEWIQVTKSLENALKEANKAIEDENKQR